MCSVPCLKFARTLRILSIANVSVTLDQASRVLARPLLLACPDHTLLAQVVVKSLTRRAACWRQKNASLKMSQVGGEAVVAGLRSGP
jgi:hypothetical protein